MLRTQPLLIPNLAALQQKLAHPPPLLAKLYPRFQERLRMDLEFRRHHLFLPALLGDPAAIVEAKGQLFTLVLNPLILAHDQSPASTADALTSLNSHAWCVAPRAMRLAVYFTWLDHHGAWTPDERRIMGAGILDFFHTYVIPVLRARIPGGHNQQFSMTFCSAVAGQAFAEVPGVAERARALRDWAMPKLIQMLGLMPASGYSGEGSTYQSDVVSGLVMWTGTFLQQLGERHAWEQRFAPNGACLADYLRMEAVMGSCGGLLPPWDHYGWARLHNLAARTLWATLSGKTQLLQVSEHAWDEINFIAWRPDDRLWTLLYWPETEGTTATGVCKLSGSPDDRRPSSPAADGTGSNVNQPDRSESTDVLAGWSLPAVGAASEHLPKRLRVMSVWDRCAGGVQGIGRGHVNPNHLIIELAGEPLTADGWEEGREWLYSAASLARTRASFSATELAMLEQQYGSFDKWVRCCQQGFLGAACAIIVDDWESYFPRHAREGRLVFERREPERHTFTGEAAAYYQPAFDVTHMRRTVSLGAAGVVWVVDDLCAASAHRYTWRVWLRRGVCQTGPLGVRLELPSGTGMTLAWLAENADADPALSVTLKPVPTFPHEHGPRYPWPDAGSERCELTVTGRCVRFISCLVPASVTGLSLRQTGAASWAATWEGGSDLFTLPPEVCALPDPQPVRGEQVTEQHVQCDLDEEPFALLEETDAELLAALDQPPLEEWRRTGAAMQTLTMRGNLQAMPKISTLLLDARQNYTVHSVAAWCLGHARYAPALDILRRFTNIPEDNTAARARWAVARLESASGPA